MKHLKIQKGRIYPTMESLLETNNEDDYSTKTKSSNNQTAEEQGQEDPSSEDMIENNSTSRIYPELTQMLDQITNELEVITNPSEIIPNFQQMVNKMSICNDLFRVEHKDQLKQLATKDIIL